MKDSLFQHEFGFTNWGGKRRGAGRKPKGERAGMPHVSRPKLSKHHPVLVTMRLRARLPNLRYKEAHGLLRQAFAAASAKETFRVVEYSVQSNHLHFLVESESKEALSSGMMGLAKRIAYAFNKLWKRAGKLFVDRYHAIVLTTPRAVRNALVYCLQNARKHGSLTARIPDLFSSAPDFDGWRRRASKVADSSAALLGRARSWLLREGWRKHGLIDLGEVPASG